MRITAKLALNQVRRNRYRTLGAIVSILLSTALTTAVFCFATSANTMLVTFLGEGYGEYSGAYRSLLLIPAVFFLGLIFMMSVSVISNVFQISARQRMNEFGVLKCVGGTIRQIAETVIFESIWLSAVGIPLGMLCGVGVGFLAVQITGSFIAEINEMMQSIVMRPVEISLSFKITLPTLAAASMISFITVLYAAYKPAKKAAKTSALACIRGAEAVENDSNRISDRKWIRKCFGFAGILADRNLNRKKSTFRSTIRVLALGILLLLSAGGIIMQVRQIEAYMDPGSRDMLLAYSSNRKYRTNPATGREEEVIARPLSSVDAERVRQRLLEYGDIEVKGIGYDNAGYYTNIVDNYLTAEMQQALNNTAQASGTAESISSENSTELTVDLLVLDEASYKDLCEQAGVAWGSNILLNYYRYNDDGKMKSIVPFTEELRELTLQKADGECTKVSIDVCLDEASVPSYVFALNEQPVRLVVPEAEVRFYDWYCHSDDELACMQYAKAVGEEFFPTCTEDPYVKEGFIVRVSREDTMVRMMNIAIVIAQIVIYGFIGVLLFIGFVSVVSTLSANIRMRAREFAVLKSVGMTTESLQKMLLCEGVICTIRALVRGIPLGIIIPYLLNLILRKSLPITYKIPWGVLFVSVCGIFAVVLSVTFCEIRKLRNQNLIECIRMKMD